MTSSSPTRATFNAIGRDEFTHTDFTTSTVDGWLTISTGKATLKYKVGSGPFTAQNVSLSGRTASPRRPRSRRRRSAAPRARCARRSRPAQRRGRSPPTTPASPAPASRPASRPTATRSPTRSTCPPPAPTTCRSATPTAPAATARTSTRTLSATIDGGAASTLTLPTTADWNTWAPAKLSDLTLTAGKHTLVLARRAGDSGNVNVDSLALTRRGRRLSVGHAAGRHAVRLRHGVRGGGRRARGRREPRHRPRRLLRPRLRRRPGERERQGHDQRRERPGRRPLHAAPALRQRRRQRPHGLRRRHQPVAADDRRLGDLGRRWTSRSPSPRATARSCSPARAPPTAAG